MLNGLNYSTIHTLYSLLRKSCVPAKISTGKKKVKNNDIDLYDIGLTATKNTKKKIANQFFVINQARYAYKHFAYKKTCSYIMQYAAKQHFTVTVKKYY